MNTIDFIKIVSKHMNISMDDAKFCVRGVFGTLKEEILLEDRIVINKFGTFVKKVRKAKRRGDINTGEIVVDPERFVISFVPSMQFDAAVREIPTE